jgi:hypothetical protein
MSPSEPGALELSPVCISFAVARTHAELRVLATKIPIPPPTDMATLDRIVLIVPAHIFDALGWPKGETPSVALFAHDLVFSVPGID